MIHLPLYLIYTLVALCGFAFVNTFSKYGVARLGVTQSIFLQKMFSTTLAAIVLLIVLMTGSESIPHLTLTNVLIGLGIALIGYLPLYCFNKGLSTGQVGIVVGLSNLKLLITITCTALLFGEVLAGRQYAMLLPLLFGVTLMVPALFSQRSKDPSKSNASLWYALGAALGWGVLNVLIAIPSASLGAPLTTFMIEGSILLITATQLRLTKQKVILPAQQKWQLLVLHFSFALAVFIGVLFQSKAYSIGNVTIANVVLTAIPIAAVLLARIFLHEKVTKPQLAGVFISVLSLMGILILG